MAGNTEGKASGLKNLKRQIMVILGDVYKPSKIQCILLEVRASSEVEREGTEKVLPLYFKKDSGSPVLSLRIHTLESDGQCSNPDSSPSFY